MSIYYGTVLLIRFTPRIFLLNSVYFSQDYLALVSMNASFLMMDTPEQQPTLVLMAGYGGSGKTTLAHALATQLRWPVLDKDVLKAQLVRTLHGLPEDDVSLVAYDILFAQAQDILVLQRLSVILDTSAVFPRVATRAHQLMRMTDARLKIILCKATQHVRQVRLQQRNEQDAGRRQLLINPVASDEDNWQRFSHLPQENLLELDTTQPFEQYLQQALQHLSDDYANL